SGFDILEADSVAHRFKQCSNGAACTQIANAGVDINTSDQVTQIHFGATATPLSGTAPTTGQFLQWNGTNVVGANVAVYSTASAATSASIGSTTMVTAGSNGNKYLFTATAMQTAAGTSCTGNTTIQVTVTYTDAVTGTVISGQILN